MTNDNNQEPASARRHTLCAARADIDGAPGPADQTPLMRSTIGAHPDANLIAGCEPCGRHKVIPCAALIKHGFGEWTLGRVVASMACRRGPTSCGAPPTTVSIDMGDQEIGLPVRPRPMTEVDLNSI